MLSVLIGLMAPAYAAQNAGTGTAHKTPLKHRRTRKTSWKRHGQQGIQPDRAREIQQALIREHYLGGDPTGKWDTLTQAAMSQYQADNGWQTKVVPDSRALIKLGLGPDYSQNSLTFNTRPGSDSSTASAAGASSTTVPLRR